MSGPFSVDIDSVGNPPDQTLFRHLVLSASAVRDNICIREVSKVFPEEYSYGVLFQWAIALGRQWITQNGRERLSVVGLRPRNDVQSIVAILALLSIGCRIVVLNSRDPLERINEQAKAASVNTIVVLGDDEEFIPEALRLAVSAQDPRRESDVDLDTFQCGLHSEIVMFTTGSTAASKGVVNPCANFALNGHDLISALEWSPGDTILCALPIYYANALGLSIFGAMLAGAKICLMKEFDPRSFTALLRDENITTTSITPSILIASLPLLDAENARSLRYFVSAAAPLSKKDLEAVVRSTGKRVLQGYGLTETTNFSFITPASIGEADYRMMSLDAAIPAVGMPLPHCRITILDEAGNPVPEGSLGEICMQGPTVMDGYLDAKETEASNANGWFRSGDLGYLQRSAVGQEPFLIICGRKKNIIKTGGRAISLDEIDRLILSDGGVEDGVSFPIPHHVLGEVPACVIVCRDADAPERIRRIIRQQMGADMAPRWVGVVERIPRTANGKINRSDLARLHGGNIDLSN